MFQFFSVIVPNEPPEVVLESPSQTVIGGDDVEFQCNASGIPTPSIIWERLGSNLPKGAVNRNGLLTIASVGPEDAGAYVCKAVNSEGEDSVSVQLEVIGKSEMQLTQPIIVHDPCVGDCYPTVR